MNDTTTGRDDLLRQALQQTKNTLIARSPAIGLLAPTSNLWLRIQEKLAEGYDQGIADLDGLIAYAKTAVPNMRKLHQR